MSSISFEKELEALGIGALPIESILDQALQWGGEFSELFFEESVFTRVFLENGRVDRIIHGIDRGVGLRVIFNGQSVYGYTTCLEGPSLMQLANRLATTLMTQDISQKPRQVSQGVLKREWTRAEQPCASIRDYHVVREPSLATLAEKIQLVQRMDSGGRSELTHHDDAQEKGIDVLQITAALIDSHRKILVLNSDGVISKDCKTYLQMYCEVVAAQIETSGTKRVETAYNSEGGFVGMEYFDTLTPESIGKKAAKTVKILLSAKPAPAGTMPVVLSSEAGGTMIHEAVGHGLEADLACHGLSVYQNRLGQRVASPLISVVDDGTMPGKRGSYRFDDEGTASCATVLVEEGILKSYLVDRLSALKFNLMVTGNGRRESFRHKPIVRMTNTYIVPGKDDPKEILKSTAWGIFVKSMGGGQVNTVTGDFVFAVTEGYLIRGGQLAEPIRGATLVGNGPEVLSMIDRVGNDLGFSTGTCGKDGQAAPVTDAQPTVRIPKLTVGGEVPLETYW